MKVAKSGKSESARVTAAVALLDRGYGKPPVFVSGDPDRFNTVLDMTDEELASIASGGGERVVAPPKSANGSGGLH